MTAWADGELVGSVVAYETEMPGIFAVDDVFVLPAWRGQGVARGLLAAALYQAADARRNARPAGGGRGERPRGRPLSGQRFRGR